MKADEKMKWRAYIALNRISGYAIGCQFAHKGTDIEKYFVEIEKMADEAIRKLDISFE